MDSKKWYASKSVWTAILGVAVGGVQAISTAVGHPIVIPSWILTILGAVGLYSIRDGVGTPLEK